MGRRFRASPRVFLILPPRAKDGVNIHGKAPSVHPSFVLTGDYMPTLIVQIITKMLDILNRFVTIAAFLLAFDCLETLP